MNSRSPALLRRLTTVLICLAVAKLIIWLAEL
jgi:hypothetical protein